MSETALRPSQRQRFSIAQLALAVPWVALVIGAWGPIGDNSFLWHIRAGTLQSELGEVLTRDPFSFTRGGAHWLTQSWLAELFYGLLERLTGLGFVPWLILIVGSLTFLGLGLLAYRTSQSVTATLFVLILSTMVLLSFTVPRPVIFSYLLFVLVVLVWDRPRSRWTLPFLFWLWASVHGSFIIGLVYIGLQFLVRREWRALPACLAAGLATLLTAHGLGTMQLLADFGSARDALSFMSEWRKPSLDVPAFVVLLGGLAVMVIGAARRLIEPRHLLLIVPFTALGLTSVRAIPPAWLGLVPLVALSMSGMKLGSSRRFSTMSAVIFGLAVLVMPFLLAKEAVLDEERLPVEASSALAELPTFHDDRAGGYLIWAHWPDRKVYLDDRAELYDLRIREFVEIRFEGRDWRPVFERDGIEQALLFSDERLADELRDEGWVTAYEDAEFVVLRSPIVMTRSG